MIRLALCSLLLLSACTRSRAEEFPQPSALPVASEQAKLANQAAPSTQQLAPVAPSSANSAQAKIEPPSATVSAACEKICARSRQLKCSGLARCLPGCVEMAAIPGCVAPFASLYACLAAEPVAHWECAEDGVGAIRDGYCEKEQAAAAKCVEGQPGQ